MPASITLSNLMWSTPDGRPLFSHLDLSFGPERTGIVGRNGAGKSTILRLVTGALQPQSGTISVEGRIGLLRQSVQVEADETVADLFEVAGPLAVLARAERGEASAEDLAIADWTLEARLASALADVGLDATPDTSLAALSGGQRTRAALAALVFTEPDMLLLDEPTNNLDRSGREAVIELLARWRGGAIVVSHDRELLETMDAIVELTSLGAKRYGGGWSQFQERRRIELSAAEHDLASAEKRLVELAQNTREQVERQARRDGVGKRKAARGDMPRIIAGGLKRRAEETGADKARLAERRRRQAMEDAAAARERIEILQPFSAQIGSASLPAGKPVLRIDGVTAGYLPDRPILQDFSCSVAGPERVAISGPNGSGKTTLLALVTGALQPWRGSVAVGVPFALLDQTVSLLDPAASIRDNFRRINPQSDENACRAALARFMFRADAALQTVSTLSGGQLLRAGLACVLGGPCPPQLLILDEPTNHLDTDSIAVVERGLRGYDGALLVVSHDEIFLEEIAISRRVQLGEPVF